MSAPFPFAPDVPSGVRQILIDHLGVEPEKLAGEPDDIDVMEDLGADSLDSIELVMAAEETFGIEILDEDAEKVRTVGQFIAIVQRLVDAHRSATA